MRIAPPAPIGLPSAPSRPESQAKKGCPSSRSMVWASARTRAACSDQLSDSCRARDARSSKRRISVRLELKLSSRLAVPLSPVAAE